MECAPIVVGYMEFVICLYCSGGVWSVLYASIVVGYMECDICLYCIGGVWSVLYAPIVVGYMAFVINIIYRITVVYKVCYTPLL